MEGWDGMGWYKRVLGDELTHQSELDRSQSADCKGGTKVRYHT